MNIENMNRKASWVVALLAILLFGVQQYRLTKATRNESSADRQIVRLAIENAELRRSAGVK